MSKTHACGAPGLCMPHKELALSAGAKFPLLPEYQ